MAVENRGGMRPTAPQNNPNRISPMGGNGQSGKKAAKAMELRPSGGSYGATKALNEQIAGAPGVAGTAPAASRPSIMPEVARTMSAVTPLTAPSQFPDEPIFAGTDMPGGPGPESLALPPKPQGDVDIDMVKMYYPVMQYWASQPDTPQATKDYVRYLGTII